MKFLKAVLPNISIALSLSLLVLVIVDNRNPHDGLPTRVQAQILIAGRRGYRHSDRGGAVCRVAAGRALRRYSAMTFHASMSLSRDHAALAGEVDGRQTEPRPVISSEKRL